MPACTQLGVVLDQQRRKDRYTRIIRLARQPFRQDRAQRHTKQRRAGPVRPARATRNILLAQEDTDAHHFALRMLLTV
jgi:hypothetical protein